MKSLLSFVGTKDELMYELNHIFVCERCGNWEGVAHHTVDPITDKYYWWSMCDICKDDLS